MKSVISKFLSSKDPSSAKRLVTLVISAHFIVTCFVAAYFCFYMILVVPKGKADPLLVNLLGIILEYDFYIILAGLGFITAENFAQAIVQRAKVFMAGQILTPQPQTKVDTVQGDVNNATTDQTTLKGDDILEDNDMKAIKKNLTKSLKTPE